MFALFLFRLLSVSCGIQTPCSLERSNTHAASASARPSSESQASAGDECDTRSERAASDGSDDIPFIPVRVMRSDSSE